MKLSENFWYSEFCKRDHHVLTVLQMHLLQNITQGILEPLRSFLSDYFNKETKIKIVSGVRFPSDHNRLKKQGFNPSPISDHLFGNIIKLNDAPNIQKYGKYYQFSVGAVDIIPECGAKEAWDAMKQYFNKNESSIDFPNKKIFIGQVILEKRKSFWIHISNPKKLIFQDFVSNVFLKKEPFLKSLDNGITYTSVF